MGKDTNIEQYAPQLLLSLIGINPGKPDPQFMAQYRKQVRDGYDALSGMGSFNHQQMLHAVQLWDQGAPAVEWWRGYFLQQLGKQAPKPGQEQMGYFAGNEPFGPSYEPFRWGSVLAVRLWATRNPAQAADLLDLTGGYAEVVCTLCALGAVPFPDKVLWFNKNKNRLNYDGPYVSPVGERSNQHGTSDLCPLFALSVGWDYTYFPQPDWPVQIAKKLKAEGDLGVNPDLANALTEYVKGNPGPLEPLQKALDGIKIKAEQHFIRWPEGILVYKPQRINGNTPCFLYDWMPYAQEASTLAYPWPSGRGNGVKGAGRCWIDSQRNISVQTEYGKLCPPPLALPTDDPVSVVTVGPDGLVAGRDLSSLFMIDTQETPAQG
jgi:hypothetical protein